MPKIRLECKERIRTYMKNRLLEYYRHHSDRLGDERSQAAVKESMHGLQGIFDILDEYDIRKKVKPGENGPP